MVSSIFLLRRHWNRRGGRDLEMLGRWVEMLLHLGFGKSLIRRRKLLLLLLLLLLLSRPLVGILALREEAFRLSSSSLEQASFSVSWTVIVALKPASLGFFASRPHHHLSR